MANFDPQTGAPLNSGKPPYGSPQDDPSRGPAVTSLVCGIISVVCCFLSYGAFVGLVLGIVAIVFSIRSGKMATGPQRNGMATAGLVLGIIGTVLCGLVFACAACACAGLSSLALFY